MPRILNIVRFESKWHKGWLALFFADAKSTESFSIAGRLSRRRMFVSVCVCVCVCVCLCVCVSVWVCKVREHKCGFIISSENNNSGSNNSNTTTVAETKSATKAIFAEKKHLQCLSHLVKSKCTFWQLYWGSHYNVTKINKVHIKPFQFLTLSFKQFFWTFNDFLSQELSWKLSIRTLFN